MIREAARDRRICDVMNCSGSMPQLNRDRWDVRVRRSRLPPETQVAMIQTRKSFRHSYMIFCARAIKTLNHDDRVSGNSL